MAANSLFELRRIIREIAREPLASQGISTGQLVLKLFDDHAEEIAAAKDDLAEFGLKHLVYNLMSRTAAAVDTAAQDSLPFPGSLKRLDPPDTISVPILSNEDANEVKWIAFRSARLSDLEAHLQLLKTAIKHDQASAKNFAGVVRWFKDRIGDQSAMTVEDALREGDSKEDKAA